MRKRGNNREVVRAYFSGEERPCVNYTESIYFKGGILYSYGTHFPLAFQLSDGRYLINGDRYSVTTACHQSLCQGTGSGFTTSVKALEQALEMEGFRYQDFQQINVVDVADGVNIWDYWREGTAQAKYDALEDKEKQGVTLDYRTDNETGKKYLYHAHRAETILLKIGRGFWVCGMDDSSYFISKLPRRAKSVGQAFDIMKPKRVHEWEAETGETAIRQGEWFFIPRIDGKEAKKIYKRMARREAVMGWADGGYVPTTRLIKGFILPREEGGNPHTATRGRIKNRRVYVSGQINHPEHPRLSLSYVKNPVIFEAIKNTTVADFSVEGRVD